MKKLLPALLCLWLAFAPSVSFANSTAVPVSPASLSKAPTPASVVDKPLSVSVDHGVSLQLDAPATSVFIANPEVADIQVMSPTSVMVFGKRTGETTLMATDEAGHTLVHRTVIVSQDLADLRHELTTALPGNKITAEAVPNGIVLTGETHDAGIVQDAQRLAMRYVPKDVGEVINRIKVTGSNQIQIRVRFAEVSRNVDRSFGIDWDNIASVGGFAFGLGTGAEVVNIVGGAAAPSLTPTRPNNSNLSLPNDLISFQHQGKRFGVNGFIDALAQDGLITILAEPNLTAMSGETASFLAGGEFPIPVPQANGTISIEYRHYGVSLSFTPTLIGNDRINMHVKPEVSQLTEVGAITLNNISIPAITTRKAETTVELGSGQSFAIAGLLNNNQNQTVNKYPFLGDMPVLGALFRSTDYQNDQSELVIIITPYIVKPNGEQQLALPTDGFSPPSASDQLLLQRYSGSDPKARTMSGGPQAVPGTPNTITEPSPALQEPVPSKNNLNQTSLDQSIINRSEFNSTAAMEAPPPAASPVMPVKSITPVSVPVANPSGPGGPGGFVLE